jgi:hypothetical protein
MSITRFFIDALGGALELGMATPEDVLRHATPEVLAQHLPRPLWAKLLGACLSAPRTDAKLVVDTIGVTDLCTHVPAPILWACLAEIGTRALGKSLIASAPAPAAAAGLAVGTSPGTPAQSQNQSQNQTQTQVQLTRAPTGPVVSTHAPLRARTEPPAPLGAPPPVGGRAPTASPLGRPATSPGNGRRAGASTRRPQAVAVPPPPKGARATPASPRRGTSAAEADFEIDTDVSGDWKKPEAVVVDIVDDDQLVDWTSAEETATGGHDVDRKR